MILFSGEEDIFNVIWDPDNRKKGTSIMPSFDPTLVEEHARILAKMIAEELDRLGYM